MESRIIMDLAIIPAIVLAVLIFKQDKVEKEPVGLLVKLGIAGAATVVSAILLELLGSTILEVISEPDTVFYIIVENFIVVAAVEEAGKYLVTKWITWKHREFNYRFDGVVYCAVASLGFALVENVTYATSYGLATTIVRALTAVPAHTIFGITMGHFYGQAKYLEQMGDEAASKKYRRKAYLIATLLHGIYDVLAGNETLIGWIAFIAFVVIMYVFAFKRVKKDSREDIPV